MSGNKQGWRNKDDPSEPQNEKNGRTVICTICLDTRQTQQLGFTVRGGLEYGIGIYVSHVDVGSQAELKGLCKGDRILRVNGHNLKYSLQKEALALILSRRDATLVVKHSGKLPYFDDETSQLVWRGVDKAAGSTTCYKQKASSKKYHKLPDSGSKLPPALVSVGKVPNGTLSACLPIKDLSTRLGLLVDSVVPASVCSKVGVEEGDEIVEVNSISLHGLTLLQMSSILSGIPISTLKIRNPKGKELMLVCNTSGEGKKSREKTTKWKGNKTHFFDEKHEKELLTEKIYVDSDENEEGNRVQYKPTDGTQYTDSSVPSLGVLALDRGKKYHRGFGSQKLGNPHLSSKSVTKPASGVGNSSYLGQKPVLLLNSREKPHLSPIPESHVFTTSQVSGRTLKIVRILKAGGDMGIDIEGGIGSKHNGRILVSGMTRYGLVGRHGEIKVGDEIMMVNGWTLVDITIGEARKLLTKAMNDHKEYLEFIVPARRKVDWREDSVV